MPAEARDGLRESLEALFPSVYEELRALARRQIGRSRPGATLNTTALVHETYLRFAARTEPSFHDRKHFFNAAALAMRQIIVDHARRRATQKRGGGAPHALLRDLEGSAVAVEEQAAALVAFDEALTRLARVDERSARVVELRFFGGLSVDETAKLLEVSPATVKRDARVARAFLAREMTGTDAP
jgi:RNA polymerase sigma factor (TIGR02999 family)